MKRILLMEAFMKKSKLFLTGIPAMMLVFGLVLTGCPTDSPDPNSGVGEELPAAKGANELGGKTYFTEYNGGGKIEFVTTAATAESGEYKQFEANRNNGQNGNYTYTYTEIENGSYSWDDSSNKKVVVLKPTGVAYRNGSSYGALQDVAGYRQAVQNMINAYQPGPEDKTLEEQLASMGFSSVDAYIDYAVKEAFANKTFAYALVANGATLLLSGTLPSSSGTNELINKTFNGLTWQQGASEGDRGGYVEDTAKTYAFTVSGYTYTDSNNNGNNNGNNANGTYAWNATSKYVYLKPTKIGNMNNVEYFASLTGDSADRYNTATDYHAARTNGEFAVQEYPYNITANTVGWDK
jgi:hypothetical protein